MSPGKPCKHCADNGCSIYEKRPDPCKTFKCAWLESSDILPDNMRPDLCGAIVITGRKFEGWKVILATPTRWKIPEDTLKRIMAFAKQHTTPLVYIENLHDNGVYTHFSRSGFGPLDFVQSIKSSAEPFDDRDI